jgi:hypothetical protein
VAEDVYSAVLLDNCFALVGSIMLDKTDTCKDVYS